MDYTGSYETAKSSYYNAYAEMNYCVNRISELNTRKTQKVKEINQTETEIKNHREALDKIVKIVAGNCPDLSQKIPLITSKTSSASFNLVGMVGASEHPAKSLEDAFSGEIADTKRILGEVTQGLEDRKNTVNTRLSELEALLTRLKDELADLNSAINAEQITQDYWNRAKNNASLDMILYSKSAAC